MTVENKDAVRWQIDHITPIDNFDKSIPGWEFDAFHWSNTQALWAFDNYSKQKRVDWHPSESKYERPYRLKILDKTYWNAILTKNGEK
jgi:hypothetical protein